MRKADDNIRILERRDLIGGSLGEGVLVSEGQALDERGVGLGLGLGGLHAEEADLHTGLGGVGVARVEDGGTVLIEDVRADDLELGLAHVFLELGIAVVELVVAEGDDVVARGIHHRDRISALGGADIGRALAEVAGVDEDDLGALGLVVGLELCDVCRMTVLPAIVVVSAAAAGAVASVSSVAKLVTVRENTIASASRTDKNLRIVFFLLIFSFGLSAPNAAGARLRFHLSTTARSRPCRTEYARMDYALIVSCRIFFLKSAFF